MEIRNFRLNVVIIHVMSFDVDNQIIRLVFPCSSISFLYLLAGALTELSFFWSLVAFLSDIIVIIFIGILILIFLFNYIQILQIFSDLNLLSVEDFHGIFHLTGLCTVFLRDLAEVVRTCCC